jgi:O-antigen ligase
VQPSRNDSDSAAPDSTLPGRLGRSFAALALALLAALPIWSFFGVETVPAARMLVACMAAVSVVSPVSGLLWCAGLLPLTGPLSALLGSAVPYSLGEPLVLAFLAGWLLRIAVGPGAPAGAVRRAVLAPALALAVVVVASAAVQLYAVQPVSGHSRPPAAAAVDFVVTDYFRDRSTFGAIPAAAFVLEGLGLFAATLLIGGRVKTLGARLLATVSFCAAGVGAFSIVRLVTVSLRNEDVFAALANHLQTIRISAAFPDPNAAGSYLAMGLLVAIGVGVGTQIEPPEAGRGVGGTRLDLLWLAAIPVIAGGLWLTGSRAAFVAAAAASVLLVPVARRAQRWLTRSAALAVVVALLATLPFAAERLSPPEATGRALPRAFRIRVEMARTAGRMIGSHPVFGVGVGAFFERSAEYVTPSFRAAVPRENAHNNFLQVLGELGIAGFVPFVWVLWAVARAVARSWRAGKLPAPAVGGAAGLAAFVTTWLAGHPLLIFEVATAFWLVLGAVAALAVAGDAAWPAGRSTRRRVWEWLAILLAAATIASVPFRVH